MVDFVSGMRCHEERTTYNSVTVTEFKLTLLTSQKTSKTHRRGIDARNSNFIWKVGRLRRRQTNVSK